MPARKTQPARSPKGKGRGRGGNKASAKAAPAPRGGRKAPAKAAPAPPRQAKAPQKRMSEDQQLSAAQAKRDRLSRRDSDEKADRAVIWRLGHLDPKLWEGLRNEQGESIRDKVKEEIRGKKDKKGRCSTKFWSKIFEEFRMAESLGGLLDEPTEEEDIDEDLLEAVSILHHENPTQRRPGPLEDFLSCCRRLNQSEIFGLLQAIMESPTLVRGNAMRVQVAALKYLCREQSHKEFPQYWKVVSQILDAALQWSYEDHVSRGMSDAAWLRVNGKCLGLFSLQSDLDTLHNCGGEYETVPQEVRRVCKESLTGKSVYQAAWLQASRAIFVLNIADAMKVLEHNNYVEEEVTSFKTVMRMETKALQAQGHKLFQSADCACEFLGVQVEVTAESVNLEWQLRLMSRVKSIAIANEQLPKLPWEELCLGSVELDVPKFVTVPESLLEQPGAVRDEIIHLCRSNGADTIYQMMSCCNKHIENLKRLDSTIEFEMMYLNNHVEVLLKKDVVRMTLECFPQRPEKAKFKEVLTQLLQVKNHPITVALGAGMIGQVDGLWGVVQDLSLGNGPKDDAVQRYSTYWKEVLKRAEMFCTCERQVEGENGVYTLQKVYGREAAVTQFNAVQARASPESPPKLPDLKLLKCYKWLLEAQQKEIVGGWLIRAGIAETTLLRTTVSVPKALPAAGGSAASSSSSTAIVRRGSRVLSNNEAEEHAPNSKGAVAAEKIERSKSAAVAKFFVKGGKLF